MRKTANTVVFGDKIYKPTIEEIQEIEITKIEKTSNGIKIGCGDWWDAKFDYSDFNAAISPIVTYYKKRYIFFLNKEDAKKKQRELRVERLLKLQSEAKHSISRLNEFTNKYFTDETIY